MRHLSYHRAPRPRARAVVAPAITTVEELRNRGEEVPDEHLGHVSPLGWEHIALTGIYRWDLTANHSSLESLLPVL